MNNKILTDTLKNINIAQNIAILFDLDGVIFSSESYYTDFWTMEAKKFLGGMEDFATKIKGHGLNDIFDEYFRGQESTQTEIIQDLNDVETTMDFNYIKGVKNFIEMVCKENIIHCLVTSSKMNKMECVFKKRPEMKDYFPLMVTASNIAHAKPAPDCYIKACNMCSMPPQRCIVFEDSIAGMIAARKTGCKVIGLATTLDRKEIEQYCDNVIDDFTNITLNDIALLYREK